jgi:peptide/nickel transport system permease protein
MIRFAARRVGGILAVLAIMSFVIYGLIGLMPGDPIDLMVSSDPRLSSADVARLKAVYGLDRPLAERYAAWAGSALQGDFGYSRLFAQPALAALAPRLGNTLILMGTSFAAALLIAFPAGILAARRAGSALDSAINLACFAGVSLPPFWLALLLILFFAVTLGWLPAGGVATVGDGSLADRARHLVLPAATLTLASVAYYTRFIRAAMIEAMRQDHIRTALAKGAGPMRVLLRHALGNAMIPVVTIVALSFGSLFSGRSSPRRCSPIPAWGSSSTTR